MAKRNVKESPRGGIKVDPEPSFTQKNLEKELKPLSEKADHAKRSRRKHVGKQATMYLKTLSILLFLAISSNASQLALAPLYGSIPSAITHSKVVMLACFTGWSVNLVLDRVLPVKTIKLLPIMAWYIPVIQYAMGFLSRPLSTAWGPVLTEMATIFPLITLGVAVAATWLDDAETSLFPPWLGDALPGLMSYGFYKFAENMCSKMVPRYMGHNFFFTRMGMEIWMAAAYTAMAPSRLLFLVIPAIFHTAFFNTHVMTGLAMRNLQLQYQNYDWSVIDRAESVTGYLSVIENRNDGFRVLRCDHSLLGGEWLMFPAPIVAEPVYSIFTMLEAVRLVETPEPIKDGNAQALVM